MQTCHDLAAVLQPRVSLARLAILGALTRDLCRRQECCLSESQRVYFVQLPGTLSSWDPELLMLPLPHRLFTMTVPTAGLCACEYTCCSVMSGRYLHLQASHSQWFQVSARSARSRDR